MMFECCTIDEAGSVFDESSTEATDTSEGRVLECDYDDNPTVLYQAIEEKAWGAAVKLLRFKEEKSWFEYQQGDSPYDQARTWVSRHEENGELRWSQLPLHAAIIFGAPYELVERLVQLYPAALKSKDDQSMLPLHLAFRHGSSEDIVYLFVEKYPNAINVKGGNGLRPLECAPTKGPNYKRAVIMKNFVERAEERIQVKMTREKTETESQLADQVKQLKQDLAESKKTIRKLEKRKSSDEAEERIKELKRSLNIMNSANKILASVEVEKTAEMQDVPSRDDKSAFSYNSTSSGSDAASVVASLAIAEAESDHKKQEAKATEKTQPQRKQSKVKKARRQFNLKRTSK